MFSNESNAVFEGPQAIWNYLNPSLHPMTPLVELPPSCNPYTENGVRIFAKQMQLTPLLNIKSVSAYSMLEKALLAGSLENVSSIVESSSMNMALCLSTLARNQNIKKTYAVIDDTTSESLKNILKLYGLTLKECPFVEDPKNDERPSRVQIAKTFSKEINAFHCGQYSNVNNPAGHEEVTAPQIWSQLGERLSIFVSTLGTCGTMLGSMSFLKSKNKDIFGLGVVRAPGEKVPGPRTLALLADVEFNWDSAVDDVVEGTEINSYRWSMELIRHGIIAGPSSGLELVGLHTFLSNCLNKNTLDRFRNKDNEVVCTILCCDTPFLYLSRYMELLGDEME